MKKVVVNRDIGNEVNETERVTDYTCRYIHRNVKGENVKTEKYCILSLEDLLGKTLPNYFPHINPTLDQSSSLDWVGLELSQRNNCLSCRKGLTIGRKEK